MNKEEQEMINWKIGQLKFLQNNGNEHEILDHETYLKSFYHRKGFVEGLEWALESQKRYDEQQEKVEVEHG